MTVAAFGMARRIYIFPLCILLLSCDTRWGSCAEQALGSQSRINATIEAVLGHHSGGFGVLSKAEAAGEGGASKGEDAAPKQALAAPPGGNVTTTAATIVRLHDSSKAQQAAPAAGSSSKPHVPPAFGYPIRLTKGHQLLNITVMHERLSAPAQRWDSGGGQALDTALKDDGPKQLQMAMLVLATVAGGIICGGAGVVACCWQGRERGWSSATAADAKEKFKGQGAQWLEMPV